MDRGVAYDFGFIQIYWYSIFIFLAVFFASIVVIRESKKQKINEDFMVNLIFYGVLFGLLGARLYYVLFNLDYYLTNPIEIFEVWHGGLAIHGGLIFGLITVILYSRKYKISALKVLDIAALGLILGQAIGRWGNFFNGEAYGPITTLEHLQALKLPEFIINGMYIDGAYRIPTFLYESVWCFTGFIALAIIRKYRYLKTGELTGAYLIWYSLGRIVIEGMRSDSLMLGPFKMAQLISIVLIIVGIIIILISRKKGTQFDNLYKEEAKEINF